jgi:hypothetical protein
MMSENGQELLKAIRRIQDFYLDVSQLLITAQTLMGGHGWEPEKELNCLIGISYSVNQGKQWLPRIAFRRMTNPATFPGIVAVIAVLLDNLDNYSKLTEPVVAGGYFLMLPEQVRLDSGNVYWFGWRGQETDGRTYTVTKTDSGYREKYGWQRHEGFLRPLVEVNNQARVEELVVKPLVAMIEAQKWLTATTPVESQGPAMLPGGELP